MNEPMARERMRSLTGDLPVGAAPVAAGALVATGLMLRPDEPPESIVAVTNVLGHTWWADGTLHLSGATVQLRRVEEDGTDQLNEFEDGVVHWDSPAFGQRAWDIAADSATKAGSTGATSLLALENGAQVTFRESGVGFEVTSAGRRRWAGPDTALARFSPDGATVVTTSYPPMRLRVWDALTGRAVARAIDLPITPTSVYPDGDHKLTYVIGTEGTEAGLAPYDLVSCDLVSNRCTTVVDDATEQPVLPSD